MQHSYHYITYYHIDSKVGKLSNFRIDCRLFTNLGLHEDELAVARGEVVVDDDVDPLAVLPEAKVEDARVLVAEALVQRNHLNSSNW